MTDLILQSGLEVTKKGVTIKARGNLWGKTSPRSEEILSTVEFELTTDDIMRLAELAGVIK